jgi:hypothetical protein
MVRKSSAFWLADPEVRNECSAAWSDPEAREMVKQILLLEQKQILADSESITMAINLSLQIVQIQLKGVELLHATLIGQHPQNLLASPGLDTYHQLTRSSKIFWEAANLPKKPIQRVDAPANGEAPKESRYDSLPEKPLTWSFITSNNLKIVISGMKMSSDSLPKPQPLKNLWIRSIVEMQSGQFSKTYTPTLFLWLADDDAKTIYRALPEKGMVLFCN